MKHGLAQGTQRFCTASEEGEAMELSPPETACPARSLLGRGHSTSRNLARSQPGLRRSRASSTGSAGLPQDTRGCGQTTSLPAAVWEKEQCALRSPPCLVPHQGSSPPGQIGPPLHPTAECAPPQPEPCPRTLNSCPPARLSARTGGPRPSPERFPESQGWRSAAAGAGTALSQGWWAQRRWARDHPHLCPRPGPQPRAQDAG